MLRILRVELVSGRIVLVLHGRLDAASVALVEREWEETVRSGTQAALDLRGVTFLDSAGRSALRRLRRAGVEIGGCSPSILEEGGAADT